MTDSDPSGKPSKKPVNAGLKYTGLAFQMLAIITIGILAGLKLDQYLHTDQLFTVILSLLSVIAGIYIVIKDFIKPN